MRKEADNVNMKYSLLKPFKDSIQEINKSVPTPFDIVDQPKYRKFYIARIIKIDHDRV